MARRKSERPAARYRAADREVICPHCGSTTFAPEQAMLNKPVSTLIKLDWVDSTGIALICSRCALIQWFYQEPEKVA